MVKDLFCCKTLLTTKHKTRRYFSRLNIVYVKKIQAFVLTNKRRYVYAPEIDTYMLEQSLKYKFLDFCPFCGKDLKVFRLNGGENEEDIITSAIKKWRDSPRSPYSDVELEFNCYDCFWPAAKILGEKYLSFDNSYGMDYLGNIYKGANFITIDKIFSLVKKCDAYYCYDGERNNFIEYYTSNFSARRSIPEEDRIEFSRMIDTFLWLVFHNEKELYTELMKTTRKGE